MARRALHHALPSLSFPIADGWTPSRRSDWLIEDVTGAKAILSEIPKDAKLSARLAARLAIVRREIDPRSTEDPATYLAKAGRLADPERERALR